MVQTALTPAAETATIADARWVAQTADHILAVMEASRSTWQMWHVRAEAQRQVRTIDVPAERAAALVDLLVDEVLDRRSVALAAPADNIEEPEALRRVDGSSVYTVAGADLYTSQRILDAEPRLVAAAGRRDGSVVETSAVDLALLEMAANGTALDAGQASLVRQMCTSGARLQLAIAPAGAGKTTAMRALTLAWTEDGGQVLGLAPSAAAAAVLAEQTGIRTDTLAKLTWSLDHGDLPDWAAAVGPSTLVIIDEAGMADTLSLDTAVQFAINRGASVRLVGDDQQLAAIGAGGVLRDIKHSHGALRLTELHRFTNPAEAAASLALREGKPRHSTSTLITAASMSATLPTPPRMRSPLGFPTERPGLTRSCSPPPANWSPNSTGAPVIIASTTPRPDREVRLADGNQASVGDVIITRTQRPPTPTHRHRLGQERRPVDHHPRRQARRPDGPAQPQPADRPAARRLRPLPRPVWATPPPSTPPKASPPTPCTACSPGRSPGSSCTRCSPAAGTPTTSTSKSSATATPTPSSDPTPSHRARRPRRCSRSSPAMKRRSPPAPCCASSTTQRPGFSRRSSATPTASTSQPNSLSDPKPSQSSTKPTSTSPDSPTNPLGRPCGPTCSPSPPKPVSTHSATC